MEKADMAGEKALARDMPWVGRDEGRDTLARQLEHFQAH
jgi:hypothetical protein